MSIDGLAALPMMDASSLSVILGLVPRICNASGYAVGPQDKPEDDGAFARRFAHRLFGGRA